jgi:hypothetical protein
VQKGLWTQARFQATADADQLSSSNTDYTSDEGEAVASTQPTPTGLVEAAPQTFPQTGAVQIATRKPTTVGQAIRKKNTVIRDFRPMIASKQDIVRIKKFKQRIEKLWKLKIRTVGDPTLVAGNTVLLVNFDTPLLNGVWYITEAAHTFDKDYQTELSMRRRRPKTKLLGVGVQAIFRKTPRTKEEEELTFSSSQNYEPEIRGGVLFILPAGKTSHRTESGTYADVTQKHRGCK